MLQQSERLVGTDGDAAGAENRDAERRRGTRVARFENIRGESLVGSARLVELVSTGGRQ